MGLFRECVAKIGIIICSSTGSQSQTLTDVSPLDEKHATLPIWEAYCAFKEVTDSILMNARWTRFNEVGRVLGYMQYACVLL
jgi:hypothetical protein